MILMKIQSIIWFKQMNWALVAGKLWGTHKIGEIWLCYSETEFFQLASYILVTSFVICQLNEAVLDLQIKQSNSNTDAAYLNHWIYHYLFID